MRRANAQGLAASDDRSEVRSIDQIVLGTRVRSTTNMSHKLDILIVGAGLSGLAAAIQCALSGHSVTVFTEAD
ncbi:hypothetical protein HBH46_205560 [Parastagonospora nodorum]|nr:hypothetical protein HBH46_205560 [Parastagonospora nodorum]